MRSSLFARFLPVAAAVLIAACGGGGPTSVSPTAPSPPPVTAAPPTPPPTQITMTVEVFRPVAATAQWGPMVFDRETAIGLRAILATSDGTVAGKLTCGIQVEGALTWSGSVDRDVSIRPMVTSNDYVIRFARRYDSPAVSGLASCTFTPSDVTALPPVRRETMFSLADAVPARDTCTTSPTKMCLLGGRLEVVLQWNAPAPDTARGDGVVFSRFFDGGGFKLALPSGEPATANTQDAFIRIVDRCATSGRFELEASAAAGLRQELRLKLRDMESGVGHTIEHRLGDAVFRQYVLDLVACDPR